jgi:signal transduction histidine kinase/ligand-binding sensor domain-containing protein
LDKKVLETKLFLKHCFLVFLVIISKEVASQTQQVKFNLVSGSNGISLGMINGITRDREGVMWFSDQFHQCIIRYDGSLMTRFAYDPKNNNSLGGRYPDCIFADSSGIIWIGFNGTGLDRFDPETKIFKHFRHLPNDTGSLASDGVSALLVDRQGNLWVGTNGGLDLLNQGTGKFKHFRHNDLDSASLSDNIVRAIYEDREGTLWIGTGLPWVEPLERGGLNRFNRKTGTFTRYLSDPKNPHSLIDNKVRAIFEDSRGVFWVGTGGDGLHTMDRKTGIFVRHKYNPAKPEQLSRPPVINDIGDHITFITEDTLGYIWVGTFGNGIIRYDTTTKKITHFGGKTDKSGIFRDNSAWWVNASKAGLFWICTQESNLYRVDLFTNYIPRYQSYTGAILSFYEETPTVLWLGTDSGLIRKNLTDGSSHLFIHEPLNPNGISKGEVGTIIKDERGDFWLSTSGGGINKLNPNTGIFTHYQHDPKNSQSLFSDNVGIIYKDSESNLWVATDDGLDRMDRNTGNFTHYRHDQNDTNSISDNVVTSIFEAETKVLWVGTYYRGLNKMNLQEGRFKHYLPGAFVTSIYKDADGVIWVGAPNALYRYNKGTDDFSIFGEGKTGIKINSALSIIGDDQNNLWIASFSGIYKINNTRDQIIIYDQRNGIDGFTSPINWGVSTYKGQDGEIFFGSSSGYYAFYPDKLKLTRNVPKINFTNFWLKGVDVKVAPNGPLKELFSNTKEIHLQHDQNVFSIGFTAIDYDNPGDKTFYYKLENYDDDWRLSGVEEKAYYFNVPPGKYVFRVTASNSTNGASSEKDILITIALPWWGTWWAYCMYVVLGFVVAYSLYRFYKNRIIIKEREKSNIRELAQAKEIEKAYGELKSTQVQLVQSEKMASLGELTAGIAHEIQNPLNFVNNFSEVNTELLSELEDEAKNGKIEEVRSIAKNIRENEEKINHHGKRADAIVKGMLQHSKVSTGQKEQTNINALSDEYFRLAYHGFRAKDKSFSATMTTDFDQSIGTINIVPQDMGRVLLNLYNNAFYAVLEKKKQVLDGYEPTVSVTTKKLNGKVVISVKDNGNGIPEKVVEKIFQPFFTTKPTGQGTGLGLSLSYDVVKAHGGNIRVETKERDGSEFIVTLPL